MLRRPWLAATRWQYVVHFHTGEGVLTVQGQVLNEQQVRCTIGAADKARDSVKDMLMCSPAR